MSRVLQCSASGHSGHEALQVLQVQHLADSAAVPGRAVQVRSFTETCTDCPRGTATGAADAEKSPGAPYGNRRSDCVTLVALGAAICAFSPSECKAPPPSGPNE
jgi:hypothetical protein